jgi:hypothetical protein
MMGKREIDSPRRIGIAAQTEDAINGLVPKIPMTCVVPDCELQGFEAGRLLDQLLNSRKVARNYRKSLAKFELMLRESLNQIVTSGPLIEKMLGHSCKRAVKTSYIPSCWLRSLITHFGPSRSGSELRWAAEWWRSFAGIGPSTRSSGFQKPNYPCSRFSENARFPAIISSKDWSEPCSARGRWRCARRMLAIESVHFRRKSRHEPEFRGLAVEPQIWRKRTVLWHQQLHLHGPHTTAEPAGIHQTRLCRGPRQLFVLYRKKIINISFDSFSKSLNIQPVDPRIS